MTAALAGPVALGVALDGRVLVPEALNRRIQAVAVDGTPVRCFGDPSSSSCSMPLYQPDGTRYLDLSVEATGYIGRRCLVGSTSGAGRARTRRQGIVRRGALAGEHRTPAPVERLLTARRWL